MPRCTATAGAVVTALLVLLSGCSGELSDVGLGALPPTTPSEVRTRLGASEHPVVLNVWASWCAPCRSEAPLLRAAHREHGHSVTFLGLAVNDSQDAAQEFVREFGLDGFDHLFDATGSVPADLGGRGVPITFFFAPGGRLVRTHLGVIDERTLVLLIDEISR